MATDLVCGMSVEEKDAAATRVHAGTAYYFCSTHCGATFVADPTAYLKQSEAARAKAAAAQGSGPPSKGPAVATYTCPMHPEVRQQRPGACPKCGMALEPEG